MATTSTLVRRRLAAQQIVQPRFRAPAEVVAWLGAVQAQDRAAARWAVGLRLPDGAATDAAVERALDDAAIVRTHALRHTWQLVAARDVRWMLALVAPRLIERAARRERELGLDAAAFRRSEAALARALAGGRHLTRHEVAAALAAAGVDPGGQRLSHLLGRAELAGLVSSGARRGTHATHALLDDRVPDPGPRLARDEALAELAGRYFPSRGPATLDDFAWWAGLTAADARAGLEAVRTTLVAEVAGGRTYWHGGVAAPARASVQLLPAFDEYLIAYRDRDAVLDPAHASRINAGGGMLDPCVVVDGRVAGTWRRVLGRTAVAIEVTPFGAAPAARALATAAARYGAFVGREVRLGVGAPARGGRAGRRRSAR